MLKMNKQHEVVQSKPQTTSEGNEMFLAVVEELKTLSHQGLEANYKLGAKVLEVQKAPEAYGLKSPKKAIRQLASKTGLGKHTLLDARRVAAALTWAEVEDYEKRTGKDGMKLTWGHFVEATKQKSGDELVVLLNKILDEALSTREVRRVGSRGVGSPSLEAGARGEGDSSASRSDDADEDRPAALLANATRRLEQCIEVYGELLDVLAAVIERDDLAEAREELLAHHARISDYWSGTALMAPKQLTAASSRRRARAMPVALNAADAAWAQADAG